VSNSAKHKGFVVPESLVTAFQRLGCALLCASLVVGSACGASDAGRKPIFSKPAAGSGAAASSGNGQAGAAGISGLNPDSPVINPSAGGRAGTAPDDKPDPDADCGNVTQRAEGRLAPADIVWIIDGSPSMVDEIVTIQENITHFADEISKAGVDHHVIMLAPGDPAAGTPLSEDPAHYLWVLSAVGSNNALSLLVDQYADYAAFLRPDARLHFIVVTDDESFMAADDFRTQMMTKAGKSFVFHAIASEDVGGLGCIGACGLPLVCGAFAPGNQYYALADATGGEKISICTSDWSMVFGPLQQAVVESAPLPCEYDIPAPPTGSSLDPSRVNIEVVTMSAEPRTLPRAADKAACGTEVAWYYDDAKAPTRINMCPSACDAISGGGSVQIKLGCETVSLN
jgi:hypothetical protein